ncbi:pseudouridine synthase [Anaerostipes sp.]|uniref:pseudouridine synthase n=1 Tax=Anaerostipes sp. TaxID=1872530 RepID=UPI0025C46DB1|nr:pseudouridine synthase [Anaerostipes sp.]MBS7008369.1 rRNA pseudouridine synthase [Anaerostipes sp.]
MKAMRLDKFLCEVSGCTRSEAKKLIRQGKVLAAEEIVKKPEFKVVPGQDKVTLDGKELMFREYEYLMMNKPKGVVTATKDSREETVMDLIPGIHKKGMFPVGRLDKDTEGLLLITNDGELGHCLLSPKHHVTKRYSVTVTGEIGRAQQQAFEAGMDIGDEKPLKPAKLEIIKSGEVSSAEVFITEGRFHQIKRMFEAVGSQVLELKRLAMGPLVLDPELSPGQFRELTEEEIRCLKENQC